MDLRNATEHASTRSSNALNQRRSPVQSLPPSVASARGRRNQQQPECTASSISLRRRGNQQQPGSTASSNSSRGRRNQQQPESAANSNSSRGRRNQQQPESTASSDSSRGRRNQQQPEETDSGMSSRGRRNQQQPESTASTTSSRRRRNQQNSEDTVSSTNTRGRRREHQRIVDYSSNLSAIYEPEHDDEPNGLYDEDSMSSFEMSDTADNENRHYTIDRTGILLDLQSQPSRAYETVRLLRIFSALLFIALLVFPSPQSEFFGTDLTFSMGSKNICLLSMAFLFLVFISDMYNSLSNILSQQSNPFSPTTDQMETFNDGYEDSILIFAVAFIFRISTELKYRMADLNTNDQNLVLSSFANSMAARHCNYYFVLQALLMWMNKVLPVAYGTIEHFRGDPVLTNGIWFMLTIYISMLHIVCKSDDSPFDSTVCDNIISIRIFHNLHILLLVMYAFIIYILIKRFRFRSIQLSDDEITQNWDLEVNFGSLSRFDKFITLLIIFLPFIFLLDCNYLPVSERTLLPHQEYINWGVERAKYEYEFMHSKEKRIGDILSLGNKVTDAVGDLGTTHRKFLCPFSNEQRLTKWQDTIATYLQTLKDWIEHLEALDINDMMFDKQRQIDRIEDWIKKLRAQKTTFEAELRILSLCRRSIIVRL